MIQDVETNSFQVIEFNGLRVQLTRNTKNRVSEKDLKYVISIIQNLRNHFYIILLLRALIRRNAYFKFKPYLESKYIKRIIDGGT